MVFKEALPFIETFLEALDEGLGKINPSYALTRTQRTYLGFCLMGILVTNSICWSKFFRASLGQYSVTALSSMFRTSKMFWDKMLMVGIELVLHKYNIQGGTLIIDDTDKPRSKNTTRIYNVHKIFDKKTAGYFKGQCILFLILVTDKVTIPVGFNFYYPDPNLSQWEKDDDSLKQEGVPKELRPPRPERNPEYPSKGMLALKLVEEFKNNFPSFKVKAILADAGFCSREFIDNIQKIYFKMQVISQLKCNQLVFHFGKRISVEEYFKRNPGVEHTITIRGKGPIKVWVCGARLVVDSHDKKRYVIALKYEGENDYRYIVASDLCWRMKDIVQAYTLRWLIEVFFQDWKTHEGWGELGLHYVEGSRQAAILSLLLDYSLLFHPSQSKLLDRKLSAVTVGSLIRQCRVDAFLQFVRNILSMDKPEEYLGKLEDAAKEIYFLRKSGKHMNGRDLGRMEPTPCLRYKDEDFKNAA